MPVKVEIRLDAESMVDYMLYQIYMSKAGVITDVLGILNMFLAVAFAMRRELLYGLMFLAFTMVIFGVIPLITRSRVEKKVSTSKRVWAPVTYEFSEEGVVTTTESASGKASWKAFQRAASRKRILILSNASKQAIILPVDQITEEYTQIVDLIFKNMPAPAVRINRIDGKKQS